MSKIQELISGRVLISTRKVQIDAKRWEYATDVYHLAGIKESYRRDIGLTTSTLCGHEIHDIDSHDECLHCEDLTLEWYDVTSPRLEKLRFCRSCINSKYTLLGIDGEPNYPVVPKVYQWGYKTWKGPVTTGEIKLTD